jgi:rod shape-determining protein MreB
MILKKITKIFYKPIIAVDFGTANCLIIKESKGLVLNEPTVVAISLKTKKVLATGEKAKQMLGKETKNLIARRPLKNGGISNYKLAYELLANFFDRVLGRFRLIKPRVIVSIPSKINSIEERALVKVLENIGVNKIFLFPESIAAAIGAELPISRSTATMIVNLGGGTTEIAIVALNGVINSRSHIGTGDNINETIVDHIKRNYKLHIGEQKAEEIKVKIGNALVLDHPESVVVSGKDILNGQPRSIVINSNELCNPIRIVLDRIINAIKDILEEAGAEVLNDIVENGIALSGGTSNLTNIDIYITKSLGIPCFVVEDPMKCVVKGLHFALEKNLWKLYNTN